MIAIFQSLGGGMKSRIVFFSSVLPVVLLLCMTSNALAQDSIEVYGFFEAYRNFDYKVEPNSSANFKDVDLNGGGGGIAKNFAPWFALFTQVSFFGTPQNEQLSVRIINNLEGLRYSTRKYGPFAFYGKGGVGFTNYGVTIAGYGSGSETKLSVGYGGGVQLWMSDSIGLFVEASHLVMGVPNLTDAEGRDKWESGLTYKTGMAVRF
jgi:opacity protein-like surface antigen